MTHALPIVTRTNLGVIQMEGRLEITLEGQPKTPVVFRFTTSKEVQEVQFSKSKALKIAAQLKIAAKNC